MGTNPIAMMSHSVRQLHKLKDRAESPEFLMITSRFLAAFKSSPLALQELNFQWEHSACGSLVSVANPSALLFGQEVADVLRFVFSNYYISPNQKQLTPYDLLENANILMFYYFS